MAKKVITQEAQDARNLGLSVLGAILFFPMLKLLFKAVALAQYLLLGYVQ